MKQVFLFSIYWFVSGVVVGLGLQSIYGFEVVLPCGALNMALGLIGLLIITRHERAHKAFYGDPREHEGGGCALTILVALPVSMLLLGVLWWLLGKLRLF